MTALRLVHAIGVILCGLAAALVTFGLIRAAIAALVVTVFLFIWSLETLRTAAASPREKKS